MNSFENKKILQREKQKLEALLSETRKINAKVVNFEPIETTRSAVVFYYTNFIIEHSLFSLSFARVKQWDGRTVAR